jgi:hypothetical protein
MPANEPVQQGPYPLPVDPPDGPNQISAIAAWAASRLVMRFANTAARDAAVPAPVDGMLCTTGSGAGMRIWLVRSGTWQEMFAAVGPQLAVAGRRYGGDNPSITNATVVPYTFPAGASDYSGGVTAAASGQMSVPIAGWYHMVAGSSSMVRRSRSAPILPQRN